MNKAIIFLELLFMARIVYYGRAFGTIMLLSGVKDFKFLNESMRRVQSCC